MPQIHYLKGDATDPAAGGNKVICHVCNDIGGWGKGFVVAISKRWPQPEAAFRAWHRDRDGNDFALGAVQLVQVEPDTWVANMVGQHGLKRAGGKPPIRYEAVEAALERVATEAERLNASVHMPRIGCGLAGGAWDRIEPIIRRTLCDRGVEVYVYDLE
jgi:O-acetyl-ADP-ribose deacetylase (regulator of RNase III)